jgi:hypothetical protein
MDTGCTSLSLIPTSVSDSAPAPTVSKQAMSMLGHPWGWMPGVGKGLCRDGFNPCSIQED